MSTKIYNGYRIDGPFSLQWLTLRLRAFGVLARLAEKREVVAAKLKADLTVDDLYAPLTPVQPRKPEGRA